MNSPLEYIRETYGPYLKATDAARIILSNTSAIKKAIKTGEIPNCGTDTRIIIDAEDLIEYMNRRKIIFLNYNQNTAREAG